MVRIINISDISAAVIDNLRVATMSDDQIGLAATMDVFPVHGLRGTGTPHEELEREEVPNE